MHRVLVEYLWCYILEDQTDWDKWIPYATFVFNTTPHSSMGFTSHELLFGRKPTIPGVLKRDLLRLDTIITVTFRNYSPDYKHVKRYRDQT